MKRLFNQLFRVRAGGSSRRAIPMQVYGYEIMTGYIGEKMHRAFYKVNQMKRGFHI